MVTPACGKTVIGTVLPGVRFHCQGTVPPSARWYMVSVCRTTVKVWTASKASVPGEAMKSPSTLGLTGGRPAETMRASRGPVNSALGRNALRMPISVTEGSCFQSRTRAPTAGSGMGIGMGMGATPTQRASPTRTLLCQVRYS